MADINIDAVARALDKVGYDEIPENESVNNGIYVQILRKTPGKWVSSRLMEQVLTQLGIEPKHVSNNMHKLKGVKGIEHKKSGRLNYFRYNGE